MNAEQFFNNGFGADVKKVHRKHVIDLMTNFAKHYHTEQCNIANVVGQSEQLSCGRNITTCVFYKDGGKCSNLEYCRDQTT